MQMTPEEIRELAEMSELQFRKKLFERLGSIDEKVNPMYEVFSSVTGFNRISVTILKALGLVGVAIIAIYSIGGVVQKIFKE